MGRAGPTRCPGKRVQILMLSLADCTEKSFHFGGMGAEIIEIQRIN